MRIRVFGRFDALPGPARGTRSNAPRRRTAANGGLRLNIALGYSGRDELVDACRAMIATLAAEGIAGRRRWPTASRARRSPPTSTRPAAPTRT